MPAIAWGYIRVRFHGDADSVLEFVDALHGFNFVTQVSHLDDRWTVDVRRHQPPTRAMLSAVATLIESRFVNADVIVESKGRRFLLLPAPTKAGKSADPA
jgi:hypothetical protein